MRRSMRQALLTAVVVLAAVVVVVPAAFGRRSTKATTVAASRGGLRAARGEAEQAEAMATRLSTDPATAAVLRDLDIVVRAFGEVAAESGGRPGALDEWRLG